LLIKKKLGGSINNMARIKPRGRYMAISVPIALHDEITDYIKQSSYNSIASFVKDAVREKMNQKEIIIAKKEEMFKKMVENCLNSFPEGKKHLAIPQLAMMYIKRYL